MTLDTLELATGEHPTRTLIMLHGLGADARDFLPLVDELDLQPLGDVRFVFPNAPMQPVTINGGYVMRAWYDIIQTDLGRQQDERGLRASREALDALLTREVARGIEPSRIVLAGFSQGCAMTLLAGVRHGAKLGGLVGLSGYLPLAETTSAERHAASTGVPVFLGHGRDDEIVSVERGRAARDALTALGHPVTWHDYPMGHEVCREEIADLNRWLLEVWA